MFQCVSFICGLWPAPTQQLFEYETGVKGQRGEKGCAGTSFGKYKDETVGKYKQEEKEWMNERQQSSK